MFENERIIGTREKDIEGSIVVHTRQGNPLENFISCEPAFQKQNTYRLLRTQHGANWTMRKPATGGYNCAGLVWASRRTCLTNPKDYRRVLAEDGYRQTNESDLVAGDVVAYVKADEIGKVALPEILHVARVCELRPHKIAGPIPWVISKWDCQYGEDFHAVRDCPQLAGGEDFELEFWTDRPKVEAPALVLPEEFHA